jgi:hypothetical protein
MSPDIINHIFFKIGQTSIDVIEVGPRLSNHIYLVNLADHEVSADFNDSFPEHDGIYNNAVYLNGKYSSILF